MDDADLIWNRATLGGGGAGAHAGDVALTSVFTVHNLAMSGGLLDAVERLTSAQVDAAEAGYRWLGLNEAADVVASVRRAIESGVLDLDELEIQVDADYYRVIPAEDVLERAFRRRLAEEPGAFSPLAKYN
jgi:hypothetical protein